QFFKYLRVACDYHTGRITLDEYVVKEQEWAGRLTGVQAAEYYLEVLRRARLLERQPDRRAELLEQMRETVERIIADSEAVPSHIIGARIILLQADGEDLNGRLFLASSLIKSQQQAGFLTVEMARQARQDADTQLEEWTLKFRQTCDA